MGVKELLAFARRAVGTAVLLGSVLLWNGLTGCASKAPPSRSTTALARIAFGSCINTNSHPMLERVLKTPFDLFVLLGDNIYADTTNRAVMLRKYRERQAGPFLQNLLRKAPVLMTWDDHDYGWNDAGAEYPMKVESQKLFLDFAGEAVDSPRRTREGIYDAAVFGPGGRRVQVILLDTRYFRSRFSTGENGVIPSGGRYIPDPDPQLTMLGETQWAWLEKQLRVPADLRVIASSIQFVSEFSGAEAWANFPREKQRMLDLLQRTRANAVVFISGDRHWAELSRLDRTDNYPLFDLTSSALTEEHKRGTPTPNRFRDGTSFHKQNMGLLEIEWSPSGPVVRMRIIDAEGITRIDKEATFRP